MPIDHDYLDARLDSLRKTMKADMDLEFVRRDTARYQRQTRIMLWATALCAVVLLTVALTLEFAP